MKTKLILIDGMPGSGKSTTGSYVSERLSEMNQPNRFYHELEDNHPLRIYDRTFTTFTDPEQAQYFTEKVIERFTTFVNERVVQNQTTIMESYVFQDTLGFAFNMQMEEQQILHLTKNIQTLLTALDPVLIYYHQENPEKHWRWICSVRGAAFTQERCGLYSEEDFIQCGKFWSKNQTFISRIVEEWDIPKLVIRNEHNDWARYKERIDDFLKGV